jgi:hypothetical protein
MQWISERTIEKRAGERTEPCGVGQVRPAGHAHDLRGSSWERQPLLLHPSSSIAAQAPSLARTRLRALRALLADTACSHARKKARNTAPTPLAPAHTMLSAISISRGVAMAADTHGHSSSAEDGFLPGLIHVPTSAANSDGRGVRIAGQSTYREHTHVFNTPL